MRAALGGQPDEPVDLLRHRQQRVAADAVGAALDLQGQTESGVGDEGKRMRRVDGQRRQHRKDVRTESSRPETLRSVGGQRVPVEDEHLLAFQRRAHLGKGALLGQHQQARILVDQRKLFVRRAPVDRRGGVARAVQFAQAGDAHGIEFVEVGGRDRQEPHPLQQRHARVRGLVQHPPVEGDPRQFAVEEPARGRRVEPVGRVDRRGERAVEKVRGGHECVPACVCVAVS